MTTGVIDPSARKTKWELREGDEIAPGRSALRRLGGGTRYEAYLAFDEHLHAIVVVKLIRPHLIEHAGALAGLASEVEILDGLDHPVIVRGFGHVLDGPRPHVVLEHLEGPRLSSLIRRYGPLPPEQLVPLATQLCSALHYLAAEEIVHLDVKPSNTIMSAPPRLIDLSVAMPLAAARALERSRGTDAFMAPEQCDPVALGPVGAAADVFGLGATLYMAATGERPFPDADHKSDDPVARWPQLDTDPNPVLLPSQVAAPVLACLQRSPVERPSPAELSDALEPVLGAQAKPRLSGLKPRWS